MSDTIQSFVAQRAETLAREFLTRRPDVDLHTFDNDPVSFIVTLRPRRRSEARGLMQFGVVVKGTKDHLASEKEATRFILTSERKPGKLLPRYFIPVIAVVFSVAENSGYYAWLAEPFLFDDGPKLIRRETTSCERIHQHTLDVIVDRVYAWYDKLAAVIIASA
jgi:hypothetical protein